MRRLAMVVVTLCLLATAACHRETTPTAPAPTGTSVINLDVGGHQRSYRLYVPADVAPGAALVLMLHGGMGTAEHAQEHYGWPAAADAHGFVVAFPDGLRNTWNAGGDCCGAAHRLGVDDVGFIATVIADIEQRVDIDSTRVYATGMSNGAMLSYRLACETTLFAAIAPVAGTLLADCPDPAPTSVLHIHGLADDRVRFDGEPGSGAGHIDGPPVPSVLELWRTVDACPEPSTVADPPVTTVRADCPAGRSVVLMTVDGAGHQWPGSTVTRAQAALGADEPSTAFDATAVIWDFFATHARPAHS